MGVKHNITKILKFGGIYFLPMAVLLVLGFFFVSNSIEYLKELIAFFFFIAALFSIVLLFSNNKIRKILTILFLLILLVLLVIKLSFYSHYGTKVSASALFVIFETNGLEASEFLTNYINLTVVGIMCVCIIVLGLAIYFLNKPNYINFESNLRLKLFSLLILFLSLGIIHFKFSSENIIISSVKSFSDYKITKSNLKKNLAQPLSNNIKVKATSKEEKTYVVVIGESTSKWHMQLYGYGRETNPKLSAIKDELVIFDSIITPNVHTLRALEKILTLSDFHFPNRENNASLVQMANAAGFETFWISNQKPVGIYESIPTIISSAAKHKTYANTKESGYAVYDEILLPYLKEALDSKAKQKLIFIHLIGAHAVYNKRYPETFDFFKDETNTDFKHSKAKRTINEYDNAIRYNDFVLREIIEQVRIKNENSYVVYFSDHGDEVYDTFDFVGHNEYHGTRPMYEIPFIAWFSNKYKANNLELLNLKTITERPYVLEDFIHSFSEISNITFDRFDAKKSIFNMDFNKKLRLVKKGEDYDKR